MAPSHPLPDKPRPHATRRVPAIESHSKPLHHHHHHHLRSHRSRKDGIPLRLLRRRGRRQRELLPRREEAEAGEVGRPRREQDLLRLRRRRCPRETPLVPRQHPSRVARRLPPRRLRIRPTWPRVRPREPEVERAGRAGPLPLGHAGRRRHLHPGVPHQDWHPQHPFVVHRWRARVLHRHHHPLRHRAGAHRVGRGAAMGGHPQARVRQHRPHLPGEQADRNRRGLPRWPLVRPTRVGQRVAGEAQGAEDQGDQEREAGHARSHGGVVPAHLHRDRPHRQPLRSPCGSRTRHHLRCFHSQVRIRARAFGA